MKTKIFLTIAAMVALTIVSCKKDSVIIEQSAIDMADDEAVADAVFEDVFNTADNASIILDLMLKGDDTKAGTVVSDSCPTIIVTYPSGERWPKIATIDYGTGCDGINDNVRAGKIIIEVTGPRNEAGSKRTVTFVDYYFNGIKVEGTKVIESLGLNNNQNQELLTTLTGGKLTLPDSRTIERAFERKREWIAGFATRNIWDDECLITGSATGKNIKGKGYTNTIISALHWTRACRFIVGGVVKIEREGAEPVELNYGNGECDAKATVTRGDESKDILLKNRHRSMWKN